MTLDKLGPIDNSPSTNQIHHFVHLILSTKRRRELKKKIFFLIKIYIFFKYVEM